jgi:hypothetical protein
MDGSEKSIHCLKVALGLMQKQDKCVIITVAESNVNIPHVHQHVDKITASLGHSKVEKIVLEHPKHLNVYNTIKEFLNG